MKKYLNTQEIIDLNIPELPNTRQAIDYRAKKESWNWRYEQQPKGRGRPKKEYELPDELFEQVLAVQLTQLAESAGDMVAGLVGQPAVTDTTNAVAVAGDDMAVARLARWQRDTAMARIAVVRQVLSMVPLLGKTKAVETFASASKLAKLDEAMLATVKRANAKAGGGGNVDSAGKAGNVGSAGKAKVSRNTLFHWIKLFEQAESASSSAVLALAPKARTTSLPEWAGVLLKLWADPAKPPLAEVMRDMAGVLAEQDMAVPSYHQARYFLLNHVGNVEAMRGRMGSREIKAIKPFRRRDTSQLFPTDVYTADGHAFDAEVAHPITGKPFRPEVTVIVDVRTRMVVGFSIDLAESGLAVLDAMRVAVCVYGVNAIFYVDNGSGYKNSMMTAEGVGLMDRLGMTMEHSIAYNAQAHGLVERLHQTLWIRLAKKLPTYMGADMDRQAKQAAFKKTRKDIAEVGKSRLLVEWEEFMGLCTEAVKKYNNLPHGGLPRRYNKLSGKKEHLTPQVMWDEQTRAMEELGIKRVLVTEAEQVDLFRPYVKRKCLRGEISLFNNKYFSKKLEEYHGDEVLVGYDIHDASRVWVRDGEHRLIAVADFEGNKSAYFAESVVEQARQKRAKGQLRRNDAKREDILETLAPRQVLEHVDSQRLPDADIEKAQDAWLRFQADFVAGSVAGSASFGNASVSGIEEAEIVDGCVFVDEPRQKEADTQADRFERWLALDEQVQAGAVLSASDVDFYELYQESKIFKIKMRQYESGLKVVKTVKVG